MRFDIPLKRLPPWKSLKPLMDASSSNAVQAATDPTTTSSSNTVQAATDPTTTLSSSAVQAATDPTATSSSNAVQAATDPTTTARNAVQARVDPATTANNSVVLARVEPAATVSINTVVPVATAPAIARNILSSHEQCVLEECGRAMGRFKAKRGHGKSLNEVISKENKWVFDEAFEEGFNEVMVFDKAYLKMESFFAPKMIRCLDSSSDEETVSKADRPAKHCDGPVKNGCLCWARSRSVAGSDEERSAVGMGLRRLSDAQAASDNMWPEVTSIVVEQSAARIGLRRLSDVHAADNNMWPEVTNIVVEQSAARIGLRRLSSVQIAHGQGNAQQGPPHETPHLQQVPCSLKRLLKWEPPSIAGKEGSSMGGPQKHCFGGRPILFFRDHTTRQSQINHPSSQKQFGFMGKRGHVP